MAPQRTPLMRALWRVHRWVLARTKGRLGGRAAGMPVLLLRTTGRRSGEPREVGLCYVRDGDAFVVVASYLGEDRHPAWWLNLEAKPAAEIVVRGATVPVVARAAAGEERERLWGEFVTANEDFVEYAARTDRTIPVVVLQPV